MPEGVSTFGVEALHGVEEFLDGGAGALVVVGAFLVERLKAFGFCKVAEVVFVLQAERADDANGHFVEFQAHGHRRKGA